jgi:flagellar motor switch protein FliN/FliY
VTHQEFAAALSQQLATVIGALVDGSAMVSPSAVAPPGGAQWLATLDAGRGPETACTVAFDEAGVLALTAVTSGVDTAPPAAMIVDTLREMVAQALGAIAPHDAAQGVPYRVVQLVRVPALAAPGTERTAVTITTSAVAAPLVVTISGVVDPARAAAAATVGASPAPSDRMDVILDIELPLVVRFGRTEMPLRSLARMGPGSLIDLGRSADDPVELLVSNRVVARGEVVVVGGNYGVRVLDVVSPRSRARSMEV